MRKWIFMLILTFSISTLTSDLLLYYCRSEQVDSQRKRALLDWFAQTRADLIRTLVCSAQPFSLYYGMLMLFLFFSGALKMGSNSSWYEPLHRMMRLKFGCTQTYLILPLLRKLSAFCKVKTQIFNKPPICCTLFERKWKQQGDQTCQQLSSQKG